MTKVFAFHLKSSATLCGCLFVSYSVSAMWKSFWPSVVSSSRTKPCDSGASNSGSGSCEKDSPVEIVAMQKEEKTRLMHDLGRGKGQCHTPKTGEALASRVIPAFHMGGLSRLFTPSSVLPLGNHASISVQKVRQAMTLARRLRNRLPQSLTRLFPPLPNRICHQLFASYGTRRSTSKSRWLF